MLECARVLVAELERRRRPDRLLAHGGARVAQEPQHGLPVAGAEPLGDRPPLLGVHRAEVGEHAARGLLRGEAQQLRGDLARLEPAAGPRPEDRLELDGTAAEPAEKRLDARGRARGNTLVGCKRTDGEGDDPQIGVLERLGERRGRGWNPRLGDEPQQCEALLGRAGCPSAVVARCSATTMSSRASTVSARYAWIGSAAAIALAREAGSSISASVACSSERSRRGSVADWGSPTQTEAARAQALKRIRSCSRMRASIRRNASGWAVSTFSRIAWRSPSWRCAASSSRSTVCHASRRRQPSSPLTTC